VCFNDKIRQFHLEPDSRITGENLVGNIEELKTVHSEGMRTEFYTGVPLVYLLLLYLFHYDVGL
jgi:hypothetical protein